MENKDKIYYEDVLCAVNSAADFSLQEEWDNSGGLVPTGREIRRILTALDITAAVANEAIEKSADLVISHHPVIFKGLKKLTDSEPSVVLLKNNIGAICAHTNVDIASGGLNDYCCKLLGLTPCKGEVISDEENIGRICNLETPLTSRELAYLVKEKLGCHTLRFTDSKEKISRVGICTGSGGDLIFAAADKGCQALITGDVKHNFFVSAKNMDFTLVDAGHYHTEVIFSEYITKILRAAFPSLEISRAASDLDPCSYL